MPFDGLFLGDKKPNDPGLIRVRKLEERYARDLRKCARQVEERGRAWAPDGVADPAKVPGLQAALAKYAEAIKPWAESTSGRIVEEIAIKERRAWAQQAKLMSRALRQELRSTP